MKTLITLLVALALPGAGAVVTYTNVDGMVLGLELSATSVIAGERLPASMIVSNASQFDTLFQYFRPSSRDTDIGDFAVMTEFGGVLPKVLPDGRLFTDGSHTGGSFAPGESQRFRGDVVWSYSLTNAGRYYVKAVAEVPATNKWRTMIIETPAIEITVTPRPEGSPAPAPLYSDDDQRRFIRPGEVNGISYDRVRLPLVPTHPKPERLPLRPQVPEARTGARSPLPDSLRERIGASVKADANGVASPPATVPWYQGKLSYGIGVLALGVIIGVVAWRSRRKEPHA